MAKKSKAGSKGDWGSISMQELVKSTIQNIEKGYERKTAPLAYDGMSTGYERLDEITGGLKKSDLTVVAGRPGMGKTSFVLNVAGTAACAGLRTLIFSPLLTYDQISVKLLAATAKVDPVRITKGFLGETDWKRLIPAANAISDYPISVDCCPLLTPQYITDKIHEFTEKEKTAPDIVMILGLQVIKGEPDKEYDSLSHELFDVVRELKYIAKDIPTAMVATSQINRSVEDRTSKRPRLSDLRDSGAIEELADIVMFLYRDEVYNWSDDNPEKGIAEIIVAKNVMGPTGMIKLAFLAKYGAFENLARVED